MLSILFMYFVSGLFGVHWGDGGFFGHYERVFGAHQLSFFLFSPLPSQNFRRIPLYDLGVYPFFHPGVRVHGDRAAPPLPRYFRPLSQPFAADRFRFDAGQRDGIVRRVRLVELVHVRYFRVFRLHVHVVFVVVERSAGVRAVTPEPVEFLFFLVIN